MISKDIAMVATLLAFPLCFRLCAYLWERYSLQFTSFLITLIASECLVFLAVSLVIYRVLWNHLGGELRSRQRYNSGDERSGAAMRSYIELFSWLRARSR